ncbi:MAG: hypothetical protein AAF747_08250 [Planctomycetota bacterium]
MSTRPQAPPGDSTRTTILFIAIPLIAIFAWISFAILATIAIGSTTMAIRDQLATIPLPDDPELRRQALTELVSAVLERKLPGYLALCLSVGVVTSAAVFVIIRVAAKRRSFPHMHQRRNSLEQQP